MNHEELEDVLAVVRDAAREAATFVSTGFRKHPNVEHKGSVDLVTSFDRESEALLRKRLAPLGIPIVGEEEGGAIPETGPAFFIDPIDGTTNFVHGHPFWCVSIGLALGGLPLVGVVVAPALALEWTGWATADGQARRAVRRAYERGEDEPCQVSATSAIDEALLATGFPYDRRSSPDNNFDAFVAIKRECQAVRRCGSAALDLCLVADGTYEGYWERKLKPWDLAGGAALVRAAGGRVSDFDGGGTFLATGHAVATNGRIHAELLDRLAKVRAQRA
jgi:myo-inositol-1(or 4)-monophosphatase